MLTLFPLDLVQKLCFRSSSLYQPETEEEESGTEGKPAENNSDKTYSVDEEVEEEEEAEELGHRNNNHDDNSDSEIEEEVNL